LFSKGIRVILNEEENKFLCEIGFTKTQAKIYLTLLKMEEADGRTLTKNTHTPRTEVYRILDELQRKGLVEKEIAATPYKFKAVPLKLGLQILMAHKGRQYREMERKTKDFLRKNQTRPINVSHEREYKIRVIEGKDRILQIMAHEHEKVQQRAYILSTQERWLQIMDACYEHYKQSLERGVKYQVVLEESESIFNFPQNLLELMTIPNLKLRITRKPLKTNACIFDGKEATFNFYPSKSLKESPIIWTNHPSFLDMYERLFNSTWRSAVPFAF
jgi:sugar-specific transcriptional regulator TrmB